ncbi:hypothetical protein EVAR_71747_1 [Eumeta japonica]|uniref:Uncharacterized protein n=1 Tax=Eumeta variegata TaxID=151549 RepID=A0A4C1TEY5_EUMVA|nr:hypothetical protein EVAR_71747_1 [Eumeta japonica]
MVGRSFRRGLILMSVTPNSLMYLLMFEQMSLCRKALAHTSQRKDAATMHRLLLPNRPDKSLALKLLTDVGDVIAFICWPLLSEDEADEPEADSDDFFCDLDLLVLVCRWVLWWSYEG